MNYLAAIFSLIGLIDATYLTAENIKHNVVNCSALPASISQCDLVTASSYASIGPIPVALLGIIFYSAIFILAVEKQYQSLFITATIGFVASIYFIFIQAFVLDAFCAYCLVSAVTSTAIFVISLIMVKFKSDERVLA